MDKIFNKKLTVPSFLRADSTAVVCLCLQAQLCKKLTCVNDLTESFDD